MRSLLTFLVVTVPRWWRLYQWRRVQVHLSDGWLRERTQHRGLQGLAED